MRSLLPLHRLKIPLRLFLVVPFVLLLAIAVGLTNYFSFHNSRQSVQQLAQELMAEVGDRIDLYLDNYLELPHQINRSNASAVRFGQLDSDNLNAVERHLIWQMSNLDNISDILYANEQGDFRVADNIGGKRTIWVTNSPNIRKFQQYAIDSKGNRTQLLKEGEYPPDWDIRQRPWYKLAKQKKQATWSSVYTLGDGTDLTINASLPLTNPATQKFIGAFSVNLHLSGLNIFIKQLKLGNSGLVFLIERDESLIASSTNELPFIKTKDGNFQRLLAIKSQHPLIQATSRHLSSQFKNWHQIDRLQEWEFTENRKTYFAQVQPYQDNYGLNWLIVTVVPKSDFMAQIDANTQSTIRLTLLAMIVAIALAVPIANRIARPILTLSQTSAAIAQGDLNVQIPEHLPVLELDRMAHSFNQMTQQLQESFALVQADLRQSEAKLSDIINSPIASIIRIRIFANQDWEIDYLSDGCETIFGYTKQEFLDNKFLWMTRILPEDLENIVLPTFNDIFAEKTIAFEYRFYHKDGRLRWLSARLTSRYDRDANCWLTNQFTIDISDRKQAEEALRHSEAINRAILDALPDLVVRMRRDGTYLDVKPTDTFPMTVSASAMLGHNIHEFMSPDAVQQRLDAAERALQTGEMQVYEFNLEVSKQLRWQEARIVPLNSDEVLVVIRDVTPRKQAELELQQQAQREQLLNQVIQAIYQSLDLSTIFATATAGISQLLDLERAVIVRYLPERRVWLHVSAYRKNLELPDDLGQEIPDEGNPFAAQLKQGQMVLINDTNTIEDDINQELASGRPGAWLLVPLTVNNVVWGSLSLWNPKPVAWLDREIEFARRVAEPLAIAIHQANLYQQSQQAEAALRESEARYRVIVEDQTELIARFQADGILTFVNEAFCRYFGRERDELVGHPYNPVVFEEDREYVAQLVNSMSRENPVVTIEHRVIAGGEIRWMQWINRMIFDDQGQFVEFQSVGRDIHDRKQAEETLRVTLTRLQNLATAVPGNIYSLVQHPNGSLEFEYTNRAIEDILEITLEQALERVENAIIDQIHPDDRQGYLEAVARSTETLETFKHQWRIITPSGKIKWLQGNSQPERRDNGDIVWHGIILDISDRKQAEVELQKAKEAAEAANRAKSEFLANMSHEIRTPMNAILGFCDLLKTCVTEPQPRSYVESIAAGGKTLLALINDILDLSKIEAGKLQINYEPVNLRVIIQEIIQIFSQKANEKGISIRTKIDETLPTGIVIDEVRLRQILFNVMGNALKFTERGSIQISVCCQWDLDKDQTRISSQRVGLEIVVEDTGIGISPEQQVRIFDAFMQVEGQSNRKYGGTGLGLAIVKRLTHLLGGRVTLQSQLGQGSTFTFIFPKVTVTNNRQVAAQELDLDDNLDQFKAAKILAVDDVPSNLKLLASYFNGTKHNLLLAKDGLEAINIARNHHPDVILLDWRMPNMDGWEASKILQQEDQTKDIPIIIVTASALKQEQEALRAICQGFLTKPVSRKQLVSALKNFLIADEKYLESTNKKAVIIPLEDWQNLSLEALEKLPDLIEKLKKQEENVWLKICNSMIRRDLNKFAEQLKEWGIQYCNPLLLNYAETLSNQIQEFDFERLPETLKYFPQVRRALEKIKISH